MNRNNIGLLTILFFFVFPTFACGSSGAEKLQQIAKDVSALELGFGDYVLGSKVTADQKKIAKKNSIEKTLKGTYKFVDGEIFVVAKSDDDLILGIYKDFPAATREDAKMVVGDLMMRFEEPTTMAHEKVIYWAFGKNGKISGDMYDFSKKTGETDMIATVKFQSSLPIIPDPDKAAKAEVADAKQLEQDGERKMYIIISSNPMSKLFLAQTKQL